MDDKKQGLVNRIGIIGIVLGMIALGIAIFQDNLRGESQPEPTLKELAIDAGKALINEEILGEIDQPEEDILSSEEAERLLAETPLPPAMPGAAPEGKPIL